MSMVESKLAALGLQLPAPIQLPPGVKFPFQFVRVSGTRAFVSGHGPQNPDGSIAAPLGKVGRDHVEQAYSRAHRGAQHAG
jgi:hypothetical protein